MNIKLPPGKVGGRYKIQLANGEGEITQETDWFDNLITNTGLDWYGAGVVDYNPSSTAYSPLGRCAVGTNNTPPSNTDTTLGTQVATQPAYNSPAQSPGGSVTYVSGPPAYFTTTVTYTFPLGAVVGNLAEIGVGCFPSTGGTPTSSTPMTLFSHALIQSGGSPTTISVTSADQLIVTFELRYYINTTDTPYSVVISGNTYTGTMRSSTSNLGNIFTLANKVDTNAPGNNSTACDVYNGSIGSITGLPSGASAFIGQAPIPSYTSGTYTKSYTYSAGISTGNLTGGISAIAVQSCFQTWQFSISPNLLKDNTKTMTLTFSYSWSRYP